VQLDPKVGNSGNAAQLFGQRRTHGGELVLLEKACADVRQLQLRDLTDIVNEADLRAAFGKLAAEKPVEKTNGARKVRQFRKRRSNLERRAEDSPPRFLQAY
jgi:hypothetical protein